MDRVSLLCRFPKRRPHLFLVLAIVLLYPAVLHAATAGFGLSCGTVFSTLEWEGYGGNRGPDKSYRTGMDLGIHSTWALRQGIDLRVELRFIQKGVKWTFPLTSPWDVSGDRKAVASPRAEYLNLPILLRVELPIADLPLYLIAGPWVDYLLRVQNVPWPTPYEKLKQFDAGLSVGLGVDWLKPWGHELSVEARYSPSITHSYGEGSLEVRHQAVEVLLLLDLMRSPSADH